MAHIEALFNQAVTWSRRDRTSDGQGGWSVSYASAGTSVGRLRPATSAERERAAQEQREITHVLYMVHGEDIARGDEAEIDGLTLEITAVREPSRAGHHLEIDCVEHQVEEVLAEGGS